MNSKERARMARLEAENARLREQLDRAFVVYREQALELVELRARLDVILQAVGTGPAERVSAAPTRHVLAPSAPAGVANW